MHTLRLRAALTASPSLLRSTGQGFPLLTTRRWCTTAAPPPPPSSLSDARGPSRFSRSRHSAQTDARSAVLHASDEKPEALFSSVHAFTRGMHDALRECSRGLSDGRREAYLTQLAHASLRSLSALDGKSVLLCLEAIRALEGSLHLLRSGPSSMSSSPNVESEFCASNCAHIVEEAAQWLMAQSGRVETSMALRLVCAISVLGYPSRIQLVDGFTHHLLSTGGLAHVPDNLRLQLFVTTAEVLSDDPHHQSLQRALLTLAAVESFGRGEFGSAVLSFSDLVALLHAIEPLIALPKDPQLEEHQAVWRRFFTQLWTSLLHAHAEDLSLQSMSLEVAVSLWRFLSLVESRAARVRAEHGQSPHTWTAAHATAAATLSEAVRRRVLDELQPRAARGDCTGPLLAQIVYLSRHAQKAGPVAVDDGSASVLLRELADRIFALATRVYERMLTAGTATALSAAPLWLALRAEEHNKNGHSKQFWEAVLVPQTLQSDAACDAGLEASPSSSTTASPLLSCLLVAVKTWIDQRLGPSDEGCADGATVWEDDTAPLTFATVMAVVGAAPTLGDRAGLAKRYCSYVESQFRMPPTHAQGDLSPVSPTSQPAGLASCIDAAIPLTPALLFPLLLAYADVSAAQRGFLHQVVMRGMRHWSVVQVLGCLQWTATLADTDGLVCDLLRDCASVLVQHVPHASAAQLGALLLSYGQAGVRQEEFCQAATKRLHTLLNPGATAAATRQPGDTDQGSCSVSVSSGVAATVAAAPPPRVTVHDLASVLAGLAAVECPTTAAFVDASPRIIESLPSVTDPFLVTQLMAAYARMLIWDFPLMWALAGRLAYLASSEEASNSPDSLLADTPQVPFSMLMTGILALIRMDVPHKALVKLFVRRVAALQGRVAETLTRDEAMVLLSALSRLDWAMLDVAISPQTIATEGRSVSVTSQSQEDVSEAERHACEQVRRELKAVIIESLDQLSDAALAEIALALSRLGLLHDDHPSMTSSSPTSATPMSSLVLRALAVAPKACPLALAHLATAFATDPKPNVELFAIIAERTVAIKNDISAAMLGTILAAFAEAGIENDRLFVEVLPRVRYVADYGTPTDLTNVVHAYASVRIWHYKLFSRIAERAVQVRHEFTGPTLTRFLAAYASVRMRQDKLLVKMSSRVEVLASLLTPSELASIASSYSTLGVNAEPVCQVCAQQAVARADTFTPEAAAQLLCAFAEADVSHGEAKTALVARFPQLAKAVHDAGDSEEDTVDGADDHAST